MEINYKMLVGFIFIPLLAGAIGSIFTTPNIPNWYASLNKPDLNPPNWVFAPVWTTLYILMGISAYILWSKTKEMFSLQLKIFWVQLILNTLWSVVFFGLKDLFTSIIIIVALWFSIVLLIIKSLEISKNAAYLLIPYLLWVSFATYLNTSIWLLNP